MLKNAIFFLCVLQACGKNGWAPEPLDKSVETKVGGIGFRVSVPRSWTFDTDFGTGESDPDALAKRWRSASDSPSVTISAALRPEATLDGFVRRAMADVSTNTIVKQETTADGFVVVSRSGNEMLRVDLQRAKGDHALECRAAFRSNTGGIPSPDAAIAWLEGICQSLVVQ